MIDYSKFSSLVVASSIAYDEIMNFPGFFKDHFHPEKLHQINISFVVDKLNKHLGGTATNIAYNFSLVSRKKVYVAGAIGKDSQSIIEFFEKNKIDYSHSIVVDDLYCSTGKVITDQDNNQIWGYYYGAGVRGKDIDFGKFTDSKTFWIISANHVDAFLHSQNYCIKTGAPYFYDPGMSLTFISDLELKEGIGHAEFVAGNDYEIAQMEKRLGKKLLTIMKSGAGLITTLGADGVIFQTKKEKMKVPAYRIEKMIDPTGAGDAWRGGFVAGLVEGMSIADSLALGNALASFAVEQAGTVNHQVQKEEILSRTSSLIRSQ